VTFNFYDDTLVKLRNIFVFPTCRGAHAVRHDTHPMSPLLRLRSRTSPLLQPSIFSPLTAVTQAAAVRGEKMRPPHTTDDIQSKTLGSNTFLAAP
jgi:hypothetical protein